MTIIIWYYRLQTEMYLVFIYYYALLKGEFKWKMLKFVWKKHNGPQKKQQKKQVIL